MKFTLAKVKKLIKQAHNLQAIGHPLMDDYYNWYRHLVGHKNPYYKLFYLIAKEFKPEFVVELGSYRAGAAGHFAVGNPYGLVATIDWHKDMPQQQPDKDACLLAQNVIPTLDFIAKCTVDNIDGYGFEPEYGYECAIEDIKAYNRPIDILFIDAWHDEKYIKREWELYSPLLADEALVICDDLANFDGLFVGMEEWWLSLPGQKFVDIEVHPNIPMGFMKFEREVTNAKPKTTTKKVGTKKKAAAKKKPTPKASEDN